MSNIKLEIEKDITEDFKKLEEDYKKDMELYKIEQEGKFFKYQKLCVNREKKLKNAIRFEELDLLANYLNTAIIEIRRIPVFIAPIISNNNIKNIEEIKKTYIKIKHYVYEIDAILIDLYSVTDTNNELIVVPIESIKFRFRDFKKLLFILDEDIVNFFEIIKKHKNEEGLISEYIDYVENEIKRISERVHLIYESMCKLIDKERLF